MTWVRFLILGPEKCLETAPQNPGIDSAFGQHAFYACLWVLLAFLQMVPVRKMSVKLHGYFGYLALGSFAMHVWAAYNNLYFDDGQHVLANRVFLGGVNVLTTFYMILSIKAARERDKSGHADYAMMCFLYSIEGAGTIRQVKNLAAYAFRMLRLWNVEPAHWPTISLFLGSLYCQRPYQGVTGMNCAAAYFLELFFTRVTTLIYICLYSASKKKDVDYGRVIMHEVKLAMAGNLVFLLVDAVVSPQIHFTA